MPLVVTAKVSADANNAVKIGSDGGLWAGVAATFDSQPEYLFDNGWNTTGTYYYPLGLNYNGTTSTITVNNAVFQAFMVARPCRIVGWGGWLTVPVNGASLSMSTYNSDRVSGLPVTKLVDCGQISGYNGASAGLVSNTFTSTFVYQPRTLYYAATWPVGGAPSYQGRAAPTYHPARQAFAPPNLTGSYAVAPYDTTTTLWQNFGVGPQTVNVTYPVSGAPSYASTPPFLWFGLTNV